MSWLCPSCAGVVELARTPLESGLVRLAALGADDFALEFDDPRVGALAACALGPCPHVSEPAWDAEALRPLAARGWDVLSAAAEHDRRLADLARVWRARALAASGRGAEVSAEEALVERLRDRLSTIERSMNAAAERGDEDERELLHARYVELGTTLARRLATQWRS